MTVLTYGVQFICDCCGAEDAIADLYPAAAIRYDRLPLPDGWVHSGAFGLMLTDLYMAPVTHLCNICGSLSIGGLAERLRARSDRERATRPSG